MNYIEAIITKIDRVDTLNIVTFDFKGDALTMMSLELGEAISVGSKVKLTVKPTYIALAKNFSGLVSYANQIKSTITGIEYGTLLCSVELLVNAIMIESIITRSSADKMDLAVGDEVTIMIKASELSIVQVLDA